MTADTATDAATREPRRRTHRRRDPRIRLRRTTVSTDQQSWIILRDIAISPYSEVSLALFPAYDANGNVTELVDANGVRQGRYEYTPFGELREYTGPRAESFPFRFSTKYWDDAAGCYYYGYRWYDPYHGRWLSRDPIEEEGGLNLYGFVGNDGVNGVDPLGEKRIDGALIGWAKAEGLNDNCCGELKKHYQAYHGELTCCLYECGRGAGAFSTLVSVGGILVGAAGRAGWLGQGAVAKVTADVLLGLGAAALAWDTGYRWGCERLCRKDVCSRVDTPHAFLKEERSRFWRPSRIVLEYWCKPPRDLRPSGQRE